MAGDLSDNQSSYRKQQNLYEEKERRYTEVRNRKGLFFRLVGNSSVVVFICLISGLLCLYGIFKQFNNITTNEKVPPSETTAMQQPVQKPTQQTPPSLTQEEDDQQPSEQEKQEAEQELRKIEASFHPFDNMPEPEPERPLPSAPAVSTPPPVPMIPTTPPVSSSTTTQSTPSAPTTSTLPEPSPSMSSASSQNTDKTVTFLLKGVAKSGGEIFCYIHDGFQTVRVREGDEIKGYVVESIGDNYAVLSKNGESIIINQ